MKEYQFDMKKYHRGIKNAKFCRKFDMYQCICINRVKKIPN